MAHYAASKAGVVSITRTAAQVLAPHKITSNCVCPGAVDTPMLHAGLSRGHVAGDTTAKLVRGLGKKHVLGRVGRPHEIGQTTGAGHGHVDSTAERLQLLSEADASVE